jgi:hypothetical protein
VTVALGELALEIALVVQADEPWRRRLEGYARSFVANAVRAGGRTDDAGEAFERALGVRRAGEPADPCLDRRRASRLQPAVG